MANHINNKLVLKNTLMLYIRMGLVMIVSLFTSRVLLQALGVTDYGIYNIVGGVVVMFSFLNNILTVAIRRFLAIGIACEDKDRLGIVFKSSVQAVKIVAIILVILMELIGFWFVNYKLNIPNDRLYAANWAFQLSIFSFFLNLIALPYNSAIVAYEKMSVYAYIGIFEVIFKLIFTYCVLYIDSIDKLILYSVLFFILTNAVRIVNVQYCKKKIISISKDVATSREDILSIFKFSSWAVAGSVFYMLATQGVNILINLFFGVVLNAAIGISQQVINAINQFGGNFLTAFNPALTKNYAAEGLSETTFIFAVRVTKIIIILMSLISCPLIFNISEILNIWLVDVPAYTPEICIIAIIYTSIDIISSPLYILIYAKGEVKTYSIVLSIIQIIYVLAFYISCKMGATPVTALSFNVLCAIFLHIGRLLMIKKVMNFNVSRYCKETILQIVVPFLLLLLFQFTLLNHIDSSNFLFLLMRILSLELVMFIAFYFLYLNKNERDYLFTTILKKIKKNQ